MGIIDKKREKMGAGGGAVLVSAASTTPAASPAPVVAARPLSFWGQKLKSNEAVPNGLNPYGGSTSHLDYDGGHGYQQAYHGHGLRPAISMPVVGPSNALVSKNKKRKSAPPPPPTPTTPTMPPMSLMTRSAPLPPPQWRNSPTWTSAARAKTPPQKNPAGSEQSVTRMVRWRRCFYN